MGGITTGVGIFSGIDSASLIDQLINASSRPLILAQTRVIQLNQQSAAYLDINSRLSAFKTAAASFRVNNVFQTSKATSSAENVITASAGNSAVPGSYNFIVDRLVSSQQLLTRGFADRDTSAIGLDQQLEAEQSPGEAAEAADGEIEPGERREGGDRAEHRRCDTQRCGRLGVIGRMGLGLVGHLVLWVRWAGSGRSVLPGGLSTINPTES